MYDYLYDTQQCFQHRHTPGPPLPLDHPAWISTLPNDLSPISSARLYHLPNISHRQSIRVIRQVLMHLLDAKSIALLKRLLALPEHDCLHMQARRVILLELDYLPGFHAVRTPDGSS